MPHERFDLIISQKPDNTGWRGLVVFVALVALVGPPRDYLHATLFPQVDRLQSSLAPILADSVTT